LGETVTTDQEAFHKAEQQVRDQIKQLLSIQGSRSVDSLHKELGKILWEYVGMARNKDGLEKALREIPALRESFWKEVKIPGRDDDLNPELEKAGRLADFLELGELMAQDALHREESCGGHFREEYQTEDNEALRDDEHFAYVAAWEYQGPEQHEQLHKEELAFENVSLTTRSYK
jgi:succinate dehydrogenase / fumarate reductase flavoprotein subunit